MTITKTGHTIESDPGFIDRTKKDAGKGFMFIGAPPRQTPQGPPATWPEFTKRFADLLRGLDDCRYVIVRVQGTANRFVQFMGQGADGMRCESVSNTYLKEGERLTDSECQRLVEMGWTAPNLLPAEDGPKYSGSPNYFLEFAQPVAFEEAAALGVRTLVEIHKAKNPDNLLFDLGKTSRPPEAPQAPMTPC